MRVGYVRVSTADQNEARQVHDLDVEKLFTDKASGKSTSERPQLAAMLDFVREGDLVIVHSMDRLARAGQSVAPQLAARERLLQQDRDHELATPGPRRIGARTTRQRGAERGETPGSHRNTA